MFIDQGVNDIDSPQFRESTIPRVEEELNVVKKTIDKALSTKKGDQIVESIITTSEDLNRVVTDTNSPEATHSTQDTAIMHALGIPIWLRPTEPKSTEVSALTGLASRYVSGEIDRERLARGVYFSEVLFHKYKNGNGRVARGLMEAISSGSGQRIIAEETRRILSIGREAVTQTGDNSYKINFNLDFERIVLGVAYFAVERWGSTPDEVIDNMKLNQKMPEQGLEDLANRFGKRKGEVKKDFINYMVATSDLQWCKF